MGKNDLGIYCDTSSIIILLLSNIFTVFQQVHILWYPVFLIVF